MANVEVTAVGELGVGNRNSVRTSGDRLYVLYGTEKISEDTGIKMHKGNINGEPASFTQVGYVNVPLIAEDATACAIDSNDLIHCVYYELDAGHGGIFAVRYVTFNTSTDTFGTPESIATMDRDAVVGFNIGIAIDKNNAPHVFWRDSIIAMGTTTYYNYYSNKTGGSWSSKVTVSSKIDTDDEKLYDIMIADPLSSVNADRPILCEKFDSNSINVFYGNALNATSFTEQADVTSTITPDSTPISMAIDSNEKIVIAFIEETTGDLMIVEHLNASAWTSWETPEDIDTTLDYVYCNLTIDGTNMYVFAKPFSEILTSYYFDGHTQILDNGGDWANDANAADGDDLNTWATSSLTGTTQADSLEIHGTNAPATGGTIGYITIGSWLEQTSNSQQNSVRIYNDGQTETLRSTGWSGGAANTREKRNWIINAPSGGWTWPKLQEIEAELWEDDLNDQLLVYLLYVEVTLTSIRLWKEEGAGWTEETTDPDLPNGNGDWLFTKSRWANYWNNFKRYYFDASDAGPTDNLNSWTNDANAFNGSTANFATSPVSSGVSDWLEGKGTNAPASGKTIKKVYCQVYVGQIMLGNLNVEIRDGGTKLGSTQLHDLTNLGFSSPQLITAPGGGWTWGKLQSLECRFWETLVSDDCGVSKVEIIVEVEDGLLDYIFTEQVPGAGNDPSIHYNTFDPDTGLGNQDYVMADTISGADALVYEKGVVQGESLSGSDALLQDKDAILPDTFSGNENVLNDKEFIHAEAFSGNENVLNDKDIIKGENLSNADNLVSGKDMIQPESIGFSDAEFTNKDFIFGENLTMNDVEFFVKSLLVADNATLSDALIQLKDAILNEGLSGSELLVTIKDIILSDSFRGNRLYDHQIGPTDFALSGATVRMGQRIDGNNKQIRKISVRYGANFAPATTGTVIGRIWKDVANGQGGQTVVATSNETYNLSSLSDNDLIEFTFPDYTAENVEYVIGAEFAGHDEASGLKRDTASNTMKGFLWNVTTGLWNLTNNDIWGIFEIANIINVGKELITGDSFAGNEDALISKEFIFADSIAFVDALIRDKDLTFAETLTGSEALLIDKDAILAEAFSNAEVLVTIKDLLLKERFDSPASTNRYSQSSAQGQSIGSPTNPAKRGHMLNYAVPTKIVRVEIPLWRTGTRNTTGTVRARIWSGVTDGSPAETVEATSVETYNLSNLSQSFGDKLIFTFANAPYLTGDILVGFEKEGADQSVTYGERIDAGNTGDTFIRNGAGNWSEDLSQDMAMDIFAAEEHIAIIDKDFFPADSLSMSEALINIKDLIFPDHLTGGGQPFTDDEVSGGSTQGSSGSHLIGQLRSGLTAGHKITSFGMQIGGAGTPVDGVIMALYDNALPGKPTNKLYEKVLSSTDNEEFVDAPGIEVPADGDIWVVMYYPSSMHPGGYRVTTSGGGQAFNSSPNGNYTSLPDPADTLFPSTSANRVNTRLTLVPPEVIIVDKELIHAESFNSTDLALVIKELIFGESFTGSDTVLTVKEFTFADAISYAETLITIADYILPETFSGAENLIASKEYILAESLSSVDAMLKERFMAALAEGFSGAEVLLFIKEILGQETLSNSDVLLQLKDAVIKDWMHSGGPSYVDNGPTSNNTHNYPPGPLIHCNRVTGLTPGDVITKIGLKTPDEPSSKGHIMAIYAEGVGSNPGVKLSERKVDVVSNLESIDMPPTVIPGNGIVWIVSYSKVSGSIDSYSVVNGSGRITSRSNAAVYDVLPNDLTGFMNSSDIKEGEHHLTIVPAEEVVIDKDLIVPDAITGSEVLVTIKDIILAEIAKLGGDKKITIGTVGGQLFAGGGQIYWDSGPGIPVVQGDRISKCSLEFNTDSAPHTAGNVRVGLYDQSDNLIAVSDEVAVGDAIGTAVEYDFLFTPEIVIGAGITAVEFAVFSQSGTKDVKKATGLSPVNIWIDSGNTYPNFPDPRAIDSTHQTNTNRIWGSITLNQEVVNVDKEFTFSDTINYADVLLQLKDIILGETLSAVETLLSLDKDVVIPDNIVGNDVLINLKDLILAESSNNTDNVLLGKEYILGENISYTDLLIQLKDLIFSESFGGVDALITGKGVVGIESFAGAEVVINDKEYILSDSLSGADLAIISKEYLFNDSMTFNDAMVLSVNLILNDNLNLSDILVTIKDLVQSEGISFSEALLLNKDLILTEAALLANVENLITSKDIINLDSISFADIVKSARGTLITDAISYIDTLQTGKDIIIPASISFDDVLINDKSVLITETLNGADGLFTSKDLLFSEAFNGSDALLVDKDLILTEGFNGVDIAIQISIGDQDFIITESFAFSDAIDVVSEVNVQESLGLFDNLQTGKGIIIQEIFNVAENLLFKALARLSVVSVKLNRVSTELKVFRKDIKTKLHRRGTHSKNES